jgi:hypothetical protein
VSHEVTDRMAIEEGESLERELFALRARALPDPLPDLAGVISRAGRHERERVARARLVAWIGGASCAAASLVLAVSDVHRVDAQSESFVTNDDAALMCDRIPASRAPQEVLESHDDTNVCRAP